MNGRVDDLHVVLTTDNVGGERDGGQITDVALIHLCADDFDERLVAMEVDVGGVADLVHLGDGVLVVRCDHLCAVVPIGLVAVVFLGIVRGCDDNAALATKMANGIRGFGCRAESVEEVNLNTVG